MANELLRSFKRITKKGSSGVLKIVLLGVALTMSLILISKIYFESSYENFVPHLDRTYRLSSMFESDSETLSPFDNTPGGIAPRFQQYSSTVDFTTRLVFVRYSSSVRSSEADDDEAMVSTRRIIAADSTLFDIFDVERIGGDLKEQFVDGQKDQVYISYSLAERLSKGEDISSLIGEAIVSEDDERFTIIGLYRDFPTKSYMKEVDIIEPISLMRYGLDNLEGNERYSTFVRFKEGADIKRATDDIEQMSEELKSELNNKASYVLTPLAAFHRDKAEVRNVVTTLSILAAAILLVAIMNYILITISSLVDRSKEIALYKCYGASNGVVYRMLLSDAFVSIVMSLAISTAIVFLFRSEVEAIVGLKLSDLCNTDVLPILSVSLLVTLVVCGVIPSYIYSKVPLTTAFRRPTEHKRGWKQSLLAIQFAASTLFLSLLLVAAMQYRYLMNLEVGYSYDGIITATVAELNDDERELLRKELEGNPQIENLSYSYSTPINFASGNVILSDENKEMFFVRDMFVADSEFANIYNFDIVDGRNFDPKSPQGREVLVSESFVEQMNQHNDWSDGAIGKEFRISAHEPKTNSYTVAGVYKDFIVGSGANIDTRPTLMFFNDTEDGFWRNYYTKLSIKLVGEVNPDITSEINKTITDLFPDYKIYVESYAAQLEGLYVENLKLRNLIFTCAFIVMVITIIGLIGYMRNEISYRRSEVAIRKIHGASVSQIVAIFVKNLVWVLIFGLVVGVAATYYGANILLETIANKVPLSPILFVVSISVVFMIVVGVIAVATCKVANSNPTSNLGR